MRWFSLCGVALLAGCGASEITQQTLKDGSLQFTCELSMDECVRRVQEQCKNERFRILEGTSETRLRDAPPFEKAYHTSRLHLVCTNDGADVLLSTQKSPEPGAPAAAKACSVGETRACVGAAACKGGQTCLPDGSGFSGCDCGPATPSATPGGATTTTPSTEPVTIGTPTP